MKQRLFLIALIFSFLSAQAQASSRIKDFLSTSGYGTLAGAAVGTVVMATSDNPSGNWTAVARGASLGLYAGILIGLARQDSPPTSGGFSWTPLPNGVLVTKSF